MNAPDAALLVSSQDALPTVVVDVREPGGLEAAVHRALDAANLRQATVAIVVVSLGATPPSWSTRLSVVGSNEVGDGLVIDPIAHEVFLHEQHVPLTVREFALLHYMHERRGALIGREELLRNVWGKRYNGGPRTVDIHIRRLRAKLGPQWFETTRGIGYKFRRQR